MLEQEFDPEDAHNFAPEKPKTEDELDMTPMIDVTFLLLIFFMITAAFALQKAISVPPVDEDAASQTVVEDVEKDSVTVEIDENNIFWISGPMFEDKVRAVSSQEMRLKVRQARDGVNGQAGVSKLLVQAHGDAVHEKLVDVLDAGSSTVMEEIKLMVYEDGDL